MKTGTVLHGHSAVISGNSIQISGLSIYVDPNDSDSLPARIAALLREAIETWPHVEEITFQDTLVDRKYTGRV